MQYRSLLSSSDQQHSDYFLSWWFCYSLWEGVCLFSDWVSMIVDEILWCCWWWFDRSYFRHWDSLSYTLNVGFIHRGAQFSSETKPSFEQKKEFIEIKHRLHLQGELLEEKILLNSNSSKIRDLDKDYWSDLDDDRNSSAKSFIISWWSSPNRLRSSEYDIWSVTREIFIKEKS